MRWPVWNLFKLNFEFNVRRNSRNNDSSYKSIIKKKELGKIVLDKVEVSQTTEKHKHSKASLIRENERPSIVEFDTYNKSPSIKCLYYQDKKLYLGFDGRIWPCCYFNDLYNGQGQEQIFGKNANKYEFLSFKKVRDLDKKYGVGWNSILNHSWEDILNHEYYTNVLPNTFDHTTSNFRKNDVVPKCALKCRQGGTIRNVERTYLNQYQDK